VTRIVLFIGLSALLALVSRASLKAPRSHGFYRFLAWESILALILLNFLGFGHWFGDPLCTRQIVSWCLLGASIPLVVSGAHLLATRGRPGAPRPRDGTLLGIEKTTRLVTTGVFVYIRHPLYGSLLLLTWGVFFKRPSWTAGGLALGATVFLLATAKVEEAENVRYFGEDYRAYMRKTKMFLPFLF